MWGGRFAQEPADAFDQLNRSLPVDHRLWPYDVRAARAWVAALARAQVLDGGEADRLDAGLMRVAERLGNGGAAESDDEDVHTLVERLLYDEVGPLAGKLNTGRSRNDQVSTDLRLWTLDSLERADAEVRALGDALVQQAAAGLDLILPGYTHGQRAQPVRWAYVLLAHAWPLARDLDRIRDARSRVSVLPLGAGAVAGSGVPIDRESLRDTLGFENIAGNALDTTGDRDFVAEVLFVAALIATHVSRLAGELITYAASEYGFIRLADSYCTGSSLLPQKRNPDVLELARAKGARTLGGLTALLATLKGLPAGYHKDLQEDKVYLFDAIDTLLLTLPAVRGAVATLQPVPQRMAAALDPSLFATDLADGLAARGIPFREAHELVGEVVRAAEAAGVPLTGLPPTELSTIHAELPGVMAGIGDWEASVERRATVGGASRAALAAQLEALQVRFRGPD